MGAITEVSFGLLEEEDTLPVLARRWGKPRETDEGRTWRKPGRKVTAENWPRIRIAATRQSGSQGAVAR